jgi:hypothetical protein
MMDCKYFDGCSAPICPKDAGQEHTTRFPDEDVCRLADVPEWVKRQRKVSKKAAPGGYFTVALLRHDCRITRGMKGINPDGTDKERAADEAAWFKAHPAITAEERERERLREQGKTHGAHFQLGHPASKKGKSAHKRCKNDPQQQGLNGVSGEKGIQVPPGGETPWKRAF